MLDELPDGYRSVITLIDLHELDYREAADILKIPVGTVKSRLARARAKMKDRLEAAASYQGSPNKAAVRTAA
jgi:RNA polymerase sigma-70 factor (ECF subfamily)